MSFTQHFLTLSKILRLNQRRQPVRLLLFFFGSSIRRLTICASRYWREIVFPSRLLFCRFFSCICRISSCRRFWFRLILSRQFKSSLGGWIRRLRGCRWVRSLRGCRWVRPSGCRWIWLSRSGSWRRVLGRLGRLCRLGRLGRLCRMNSSSRINN